MQTCSTESKMPGEIHQPCLFPSPLKKNCVQHQMKRNQSCFTHAAISVSLLSGWDGRKKSSNYLATWKCHHQSRSFHLMCLYVLMQTIFSFGFEAWEWVEHGKHVMAHKTTSQQNDLHLDNGFRELSEAIVKSACTNTSTQLPHLNLCLLKFLH